MKDTREEDTVSHKNTNQQNNNSSVPSAICPPEKAAVPIQDCKKLYETYSYVPSEEEEEIREARRNRKKSFLKLMAMALSIVLAVFFATFSWFTMNRDTSGNGMSVSVSGPLFAVDSMSSPYVAGIYDDPQSGTYVRNKLLTGASKDDNVLTWTITANQASTDPQTNRRTIIYGKNIGNGPATGENGGIIPGSSGELNFKFIPRGSVDAAFNFVFYAYSVEYDNEGEEIPNSIALIGSSDQTPPERIVAKTLLNGHILLFKNYNEQTKKYSGLIASDQDFNRLMTETYNTETTVKIYWVWVETLSQLILDDTNDAHKRNLRGQKSITSNRSEIIDFFKQHPSWFLLDPDDPDKNWTQFTASTPNEDVVSVINNNYTLYSSYYNEADQCIGTTITYLLLDMMADGTATPTS